VVYGPTDPDPYGGAAATDVSFAVVGNARAGRAAPLPAPPPGYEILKRLGGGGMGDVYLAREQAADRRVAMKFLRFPGNPELHDRFALELRVLAKLDHPHIVRVFAADFLRADPYFTMEYLETGPLERTLERGPVPPDEAVRIARAVAAALAAAHAAEVIHRDLKPSNVLLARDGTPKVADFGLAKRLDEVDPVTLHSGGVGTPGYMPPEQISKTNGAAGPWSDVYGLGATLYHLLTGRPPFVGDTPIEIISRVLAAPPRLPRALVPGMPAALEAIVVKCLEKRPRDRYPSMAELVADLDRYAARLPPLAPPVTRRFRAKRWVRRNRVAVACGVLASALALGLVGAGRATAPTAVAADPVAAKAKRLEAVSADLRAGKPVPLVGETGEPAWYEAPTGLVAFGENPTRTARDPGGCYFKSYELTVLKLLDPPIDRYRIKLQLRHLAGPESRQPVLGFFAALGFAEPADGWKEYSFLSVGYTDRNLGFRDGRVVPPAVTVGSRAYANPPGQYPSGHLCDSHLATKPLLDGDQMLPGPWRTLVVDVSPDGLAAYWGAAVDRNGDLPANAVPFADVPVERIRKHRALHARGLEGVGRNENRVFAPLPDWSPRSGVGVWACGAEVAFKNVVVYPK
jgi:serine/threonine-protein kinase